MSDRLLEDVLKKLDAENELPSAVSELVLASLMNEVESCLGGRVPERPAPSETATVEPVRAFVDAIEVEGFRGIGARTKLALTPGPGLTLVVGRNGSGKSSFAEALELLLTGDNQRWSSHRSKIWREGWRNLHTPDATRLEARLLIDGEAGPYSVVRSWAAEQTLDDGEASVNRGGESAPLSKLGWQEPLATYRPFLSYNELGSMLEEGPSKLFDALASILGLEELVRAADALKEARSTRSKAHKSVKDRWKTLRAELEAHGDERAAKCLGLLKGTKWKLDALDELLAGSGGTAQDSELADLRELAQVTSPDPEAVAKAASELREAAEARAALEGTDAEASRRIAGILAEALALHADHGDRDCPVCGQAAALSDAWKTKAEAEVRTHREQAAAVDAAIARLADTERRARELVPPAPAALERAELTAAESARKAWDAWHRATAGSGAALADVVERTTRELAASLDALRGEARETLQAREDAWRPMAHALRSWLPEAEKMLAESDVLGHLKSAEDWLRTAATEIRNERFQPIKERVRGIWELLRTESHVELEDITFEGKSTSRRVSLDVTVDGTEGVALGVMSQGELHSLALALFLPRATMPESPFRFLVIDDPVQSMDPARVDGLARVLDQVAKDRQVVVFTHDDRLPEAARRLGVEAKVIEVVRRNGSVVELREVRSPVRQYLDDAFALASTKDLPKLVAERVLPGLCRSSLEAACVDVVRRRRLERGESHEAVEELFRTHTKLVPRLALALHDDAERGGDVYSRLTNAIGPWSVDVVKECNTGSHKGLAVDDAFRFVKNVQQIAQAILALS